jgi:VWFA-related protein
MAGAPVGDPGPAEPASIVIFVDENFLPRPDRNRVLARLRRDLSLLGPDDRVAVVDFHGERPMLMTGWTSAVGARDALSAMSRRPAGDWWLVGTGRRAEGDPLRAEAEARLLTEKLDVVVAAAVATLRGLDAPGGRKAMLVLTGGWPLSPFGYFLGTDELDARVLPCPTCHTTSPEELVKVERRIRGGAEVYAPLVDTASVLGYTLYMADLSPFVARVGDAASATPDGALTAMRRDFGRRRTLHDSLRMLADATGGQALLGRRAEEALAAAMDDAASYYRLGFTPDWPRDEARHQVEVEVLRPGLVTRTREVLLAPSREGELKRMVESRLRFGAGEAGGADRLVVTVSSVANRGQARHLDLEIEVPLALLTLQPAGAGLQADAELFVGTSDGEGRAGEIHRLPLVVRVAEPSSGRTIRHRLHVAVPPGVVRVGVAVHDPVSGRLSHGSVELP